MRAGEVAGMTVLKVKLSGTPGAVSSGVMTNHKALGLLRALGSQQAAIPNNRMLTLLLRRTNPKPAMKDKSAGIIPLIPSRVNPKIIREVTGKPRDYAL